MSPLLIALLGVMLVPVFISTWRSSLLGLSTQGFMMAWIFYSAHPELNSAGQYLTLFDLVIVRGLFAPFSLYGVLSGQRAPQRNDIIPPNLLSWTFALGFVLVAFNFSDDLTKDPEEQTFLAVTITGLLLGFLVLATQTGPLSQMIGAMRFENAIALFEFSGEGHNESLGIKVGQIVIVIVTILLFRWHLKILNAKEELPATPEEATL